MQEVKFKVFCRKHECWEKYTLGDLIVGGADLGKGEGIFKGETWKQFTGLIDKNGTEIYDGDIVEYGKRLYEVKISFNGFYLQRYKLWRGQFKPAFKYNLSLITLPKNNKDRGEAGGIVKEAEVVGNGFDNPELIGQIHEV